MAEDKTTPGGANKYSVYAQRSVDSTQINWNEISGQLVKGLETIRDERQSRKDAIEKSTQDAIEQLSQVPETGTQDAASLLINGSAMSIKSVQEQNDLMKRGLISPKDNMLFMQQQKNGYKSLSTAVKGWDAWAVEARTRLEDPNISSGNLETFTNLQTEALGNLRNKKLWTNPTNGKMQLVTMGYNKTTKLYDVMPDYETRKQDYQNPNTMLNFMKYKNAGVDVNEMAKKQTANIAEIITSERARLTALGGGGGITSIEDFRQLGTFGKDESGKTITYDMWKKDQIDAMVGTASDKSNLSAAEVLTNSGGYFFAQTESQFKEEHPNIDISRMIKVDMSTGQPVPTMNEAQLKQARKLADVAVESQVSHLVKMTEGKGAQQEDQDTANTTRVKEEEDRNKAYFKDIDKIITAPANEGAAVSQDRLTDMNQQFLNSTNYTDQNTKINSIKRGANEIVIDKTVRGVNKPVTVDKFFRDPKTDKLDLKRPLTSKEIARQIYRELIPRGATEKMSFDDFYDAAIKNGMDFTPKMIKDEKGNMVPNKAYGADEEFGTKTQIEKISRYSSDNIVMVGETEVSMALEFQGLVDKNGKPGYTDNFVDAAPVVLKAFNQGLRNVEKAYGSSLGIEVSYNDKFGSGDNEIIYSYKDPVTGKVVSDKFIYNDDNTKLQSEVDKKINEIIDAYNASRASGETTPGGSGGTEEKPDMG
jgi:hypothetical protein